MHGVVETLQKNKCPFSMNDREKTPGGMREGVAKCISQACVYSLESKKTLLQVHGRIPKLPLQMVWHRWLNGIITSSITSGLVFGTYFTVYNGANGHMMAGTTAALASSVLKVPISNGMRLMQSGRARTIVHAGRKIVKAHSWKGLYSGYRISLIEDIVEFDLRTRMYRNLRGMDPHPDVGSAIKGLFYGALSGAVTAGITTPFDTIKAHVAQEAANPSKTVSAWRIAHQILQNRGVGGLFSGVQYRVASNMVKSALFFTVFELMPI